MLKIEEAGLAIILAEHEILRFFKRQNLLLRLLSSHNYATFLEPFKASVPSEELLLQERPNFLSAMQPAGPFTFDFEL